MVWNDDDGDGDYRHERYVRRRGMMWDRRPAQLEYDEVDVVHYRAPRRSLVPRYPALPYRRRPISPSQYVAMILLLLLVGAVIWWWWSGDGGEYRRFPPSGSVTAANTLRPGSATAILALHAGTRNAIVQLLDPETNDHVLSIFMREGERRAVPVPPGNWHLRVIEGHGWLGPRRLFGQGTKVTLLRGVLHIHTGQRVVLSVASPELPTK